MASPYDRLDGRGARRRPWSHWLPIALAVTVAAVGVAGWVLTRSDRDDDDDDKDARPDAPPPPDLDYEYADYGDNPAYGSSASRAIAGRRAGQIEGVTEAGPPSSTAGWGARVSGALRRTPSPQQFLDSAGKTVAAGVAAAGAAVGSALASIREEDKGPYDAAGPWPDEAEARKDRPSGPKAPRPRKVIAVVVSADVNTDGHEGADDVEHATILSYIPRNIDYSRIKLYVFVYAPGLKDVQLEGNSNGGGGAVPAGAGAVPLPSASLSSSFSNIGHELVQTPDDSKSPQYVKPSPEASSGDTQFIPPGYSPVSRQLMAAARLQPSAANSAFHAVYTQAGSLVETPTMVLPFTTPSGYVHMLRHFNPDIIYLQESLSGNSGSVVAQIQTWFRHDVVVVVGAEGGHGGLVDSESEADKPSKQEAWWRREDRVGRGRGVVVVDGMRVHDDWLRRVQGKE